MRDKEINGSMRDCSDTDTRPTKMPENNAQGPYLFAAGLGLGQLTEKLDTLVHIVGLPRKMTEKVVDDVEERLQLRRGNRRQHDIHLSHEPAAQ